MLYFKFCLINIMVCIIMLSFDIDELCLANIIVLEGPKA